MTIRPEQNPSIRHEELMEQIYSMAATQFRRQSPGHTLQPTAIVNELWIRMMSGSDAQFSEEREFRAWAAKVVRSILVDHARKRSSLRRGGGRTREQLSPHGPAANATPDAIELHEELELLERVHERSARVVELRFYGGMSDRQIADQLGVSDRTVRADWVVARAWLRRRLGATDVDP